MFTKSLALSMQILQECVILSQLLLHETINVEQALEVTRIDT